MQADFEFTPDDHVAFVTIHNERSPTIRKQRRSLIGVVVFFMWALPALILLTTDKPILETAKAIRPLLVGAFGSVVFLLIFFPYLRWKVTRMTKRMLAEGQNTGLYGPCSLSIEANGLRETKPTGESSRNWSTVERVLVTDTHAFIYTSATEAFVLPRRAFQGTEAFQHFVDELSECGGVVQEIV